MSSSSQFAAVLPIVFIALVLWLIHRIRYVIDDQYVRVVLVGITLRKVALADIEAVDTKAPWWNEHWCNTLWACGRVVRLRRRSGCVRNFIITPKNRDELTTYVARKKGFVSIARDHFNVLELLALTPVGFLVILHFVGHEDLGQSRFTGVTKLKFEIIVAQQRGLMAEPATRSTCSPKRSSPGSGRSSLAATANPAARCGSNAATR
jgi:hypothetical protein